MSEPKTYCNAITSAKERTFRDNGSILCVGIKADKMIEFLNQNKNEKGYCNIVLAKRRQASEHGDTHYAYLDTFKPTPRGDQQRSSAPADTNPRAKIDREDVPPQLPANNDSQEVPF